MGIDQMTTYRVSFFVPCYNEEQAIQRTLKKIVDVAATFDLLFEILVFDDCSKDFSVQKIREFQQLHPHVAIRLFTNQVNCGLGFNYIEGAFRARGEHYMLVNGDDSETPESMKIILSHMGEAEIIIPYMIDVRSVARVFISNIFTHLVNLISGHRLEYYNGPVLHKTKYVRRWHPNTGGYAYQAEMLCMLIDHKRTYLEVEITHNDRDQGASKAFKLKNVLSVGHSLSQIALRRLKNLIWSPQDLDLLAQEVACESESVQPLRVNLGHTSQSTGAQG